MEIYYGQYLRMQYTGFGKPNMCSCSHPHDCASNHPLNEYIECASRLCSYSDLHHWRHWN